jgi:thioredoxin reductase (NADPH)
VKVRYVKTGEIEQLETDGVFIFIGHYPNSTLFEGQLEMDTQGYLSTGDRMQASVPGVFAAGEIQDPVWRQVATSVGQGAAAAIACTRWLEEHEYEKPTAST